MKKLFFTIIAFTILPTLLLCQDIIVTRDFGIWGGLVLEKEFSKHIEMELEQQVRFYNNATTLDDYLVDLGGHYYINKNFKLGFNLRYIYNAKRWSKTEHDLRYNFDLIYKANLANKLKLFYRFRNHQVNIINTQPLALGPKTIAFRHRLKIKYKYHNKNSLYVSTEAFRYIENLSLPYWGQLRLKMGNIFETMIGDFDCSFGLEKELNAINPYSFFYFKTVYIISL
jgi:hypothetical protein